jgi:hypothetical protein
MTEAIPTIKKLIGIPLQGCRAKAAHSPARDLSAMLVRLSV